MKMTCTCKHESQDKLNGKNIRIWNECTSKSAGEKRYRCTVCGSERNAKGKDGE
jgi:hypothetical protein